MTTSNENPTGCCGGSDCPNCPDGAAAKYKATISGVTNGFCNDCENANGEHILEHISGCLWGGAVTLCSGTNAMQLERTATGWILGFTVGVGSVVYREDLSTSCLTEETLDLDHIIHPGLCENWPDTVTVEPL